MEREELLTFVVEEIVERKKEGRPLKVGVDGRCASGKSVLADEASGLPAPAVFAARIPCPVPSSGA